MHWQPLVVCLVIVGALVVVGRILDRRERKKRIEAAATLHRRHPPQAVLLKAEYTAAESEIAPRVYRIIADVSGLSFSPPKTSIDPAILLPEDDLIENLGYGFDSLSMLELVLKLEREFGLKLRRNTNPLPMTVRGVVKWVSDEISKRGKPTQ